jgi:putative heme-binding domain-containing protein
MFRPTAVCRRWAATSNPRERLRHLETRKRDDDMDHKFKVAVGAICTMLCALCLSGEALGQTLPDGKGKEEFVHNCTACHSATLVTRNKKTPDEWKKNVFDMAARGTDGTKEDLDNVVLYMVTNYATDKPAMAAATQSPTPPSTLGGPAELSSSEIERAKRVIADNGCLGCHRIEKQGRYIGPALNGVGGRRTADKIRTAIVSPHPTLDPNNNLVRLTTPDGKTLVGRLLSQDDHDVRIIDASGEVATYSKPGLLRFTMIDTNPMPSFEGKITGEDLDSLVRYLGSLPSVDESVQK